MSEIWSKICIGIYVKVRVILSGFDETCILSTGFRKNTQISHLMKIRLVGAELQEDRRIDRHDEAYSRFSRFCERAKKKIMIGPILCM